MGDGVYWTVVQKYGNLLIKIHCRPYLFYTLI
jgi:hypothetical protein